MIDKFKSKATTYAPKVFSPSTPPTPTKESQGEWIYIPSKKGKENKPQPPSHSSR